jgi:cytosine/adenosine deaminase-related metal-dependent hydrolase
VSDGAVFNAYRPLPGESSSLTLYRSPWLVTMAAPGFLPAALADDDAGLLIEDGAVCVAGQRIVDVGRFADLRKRYGRAALVDYEDSVLTPGLVNGHAHLELSHTGTIDAAAVGRRPVFTDWIRELIARRDDSRLAETGRLEAARAMLDSLHSSGVGLLADIGNDPASIEIGRDSAVHVCFFLELIGMSKTAGQRALDLQHMLQDADDFSCTVHSPYACSSDLIRYIKKQASQRGHFLPLHVAETINEIEFLRSGSGEIKDFLVERGSWDNSFVPLGRDGAGAVSYLDALGVLDAKTLCVHTVHVTPAEINMLAARQAKVCLCPGSNRFLGVGRAPVRAMLEAGLLPALGTDSLASNPVLNIWQEMNILREEQPGIRPSLVFGMATRGGAEALGFAGSFGVLRPGARTPFLRVFCRETSPALIFEYLTTLGLEACITWVGCKNVESGQA